LALNKTTKSENRDGPSQSADKLIIVALKIYYLPLYSNNEAKWRHADLELAPTGARQSNTQCYISDLNLEINPQGLPVPT
jgi:hypothetical protein